MRVDVPYVPYLSILTAISLMSQCIMYHVTYKLLTFNYDYPQPGDVVK